MSEDDKTDGADAHRQFVDLIERSGFFQQIRGLETSLATVADELKAFGEHAAKRMQETENLAAHVLAIESVLTVMLKSHPVAPDDLDAEVKDRTAAMVGNADGSPTVRALARDILEKATG